MAYSSFFRALMPFLNAFDVYSVFCRTTCTAVLRLSRTFFFMLGLSFSILTMSLSSAVTGR